jgi:hypothetical protein
MKKESLSPIVKLRKIIRHGNSYYICIPQPFIRLHDLKVGQKVPILCDHILKLVPMQEK